MRLREATLTNQSGNFRGTKDSLEHAKEVMQQAGAPKNLQVQNVIHANGNFSGVHTKAAEDVNLALEYKANPQLKQIWDETREVMSRFKNVTEKEFGERVGKDFEINGIGEHAADISFYGWWKTPREGEAWAINKILRNGKGQENLDIPRFRELLNTLRRIADQK